MRQQTEKESGDDADGTQMVDITGKINSTVDGNTDQSLTPNIDRNGSNTTLGLVALTRSTLLACFHSILI